MIDRGFPARRRSTHINSKPSAAYESTLDRIETFGNDILRALDASMQCDAPRAGTGRERASYLERLQRDEYEMDV